MTEYIELISPLCLHLLDNFYRCKNFIKYDIALRKKKGSYRGDEVASVVKVLATNTDYLSSSLGTHTMERVLQAVL